MTKEDRIAKLVRDHLDPALLLPVYRESWSKSNPTKGFCSVASEAAWFLLGGSQAGWISYAARDASGGTHWWLQHKNGQRLDITADQYTSIGQTPPYDKGRPVGFMGIRHDPENLWGNFRKPSKRAFRLLSMMQASLDVPLMTWSKQCKNNASSVDSKASVVL